MEYSVAYEDDSILIIDKPQGLATTPGMKDNLCDIIFHDFPDLKNVKGYKKNEGGLLNRLDNETGGMVLFARSNEAFNYYSNQMKQGKIKKIYAAIVKGVPEESEGIIKLSIAHHFTKNNRMVVVKKNTKYRGRSHIALTCYKLIRTNRIYSQLEIKIVKGFRHQIRVHLSGMDLPIIGDKLYNKEKFYELDNHLLYANGIIFINLYGKKVNVTIDVPFLKKFFIHKKI